MFHQLGKSYAWQRGQQHKAAVPAPAVLLISFIIHWDINNYFMTYTHKRVYMYMILI